MNIDWSRMVTPQPDLYDSYRVLELAKEQGNDYIPPPRDGVPLIFDHQVAVNYIMNKPSLHYINAPLDHPNIAKAVAMVKRYPLAFEQFKIIMNTFHPLDDPSVPDDSLGSSSHGDEDRFGTMYATVYNPHGLAQAFVHEMAHNKLRGMGLFFESTKRLITNDSNNLYVSPIVKNRLRPMTAVFHAQYSFMYVTALDIYNIQAEKDKKELIIWLLLLKRNLHRMELGHREISNNIEVDNEGEIFVNVFLQWSDEILKAGKQLLKKYKSFIFQ